jgi:hypothetical protein
MTTVGEGSGRQPPLLIPFGRIVACKRLSCTGIAKNPMLTSMYSLLSPAEEVQIRNYLSRNKAMAEWEKKTFAVPSEYLPRTVAIALANRNPTFVFQLFRERT